jgi:DNA polymerase
MTDPAEPFQPARPSLRSLTTAAADCRGCELYEDATQTVFGAGPVHSPAMFVGEQPGDIEDRDGTPFVGPAGRLLDRAFADVGIDRDGVYLTNAVRHFRWRPAPRGKRRPRTGPTRTTRRRSSRRSPPCTRRPCSGPRDRGDAYSELVHDLTVVARTMREAS